MLYRQYHEISQKVLLAIIAICAIMVSDKESGAPQPERAEIKF